MQVLNKQSSSIFLDLIKKLGKEQYIKLESSPFMVLHFERIGHMHSAEGVSNIYSLMHSYLQDGDLMRDPEMCFLHFYNDSSDRTKGIAPYSYSQDALGVYEVSVVFPSWYEIALKKELQRKHTAFANQWLKAIKEQGYLL